MTLQRSQSYAVCYHSPYPCKVHVLPTFDKVQLLLSLKMPINQRVLVSHTQVSAQLSADHAHSEEPGRAGLRELQAASGAPAAGGGSGAGNAG